MEFTQLIPKMEAIPAPAWLFEILDILLFTVHILLVNIVVGGILIMLYNRFFGKNDNSGTSFHSIAAKPVPTTFALAINMGVAPLLFVQVIYGNYIYTSSILMATFWILVIPLLIIAYYGAYINNMNYDKRRGLAKFSLLVAAIVLLYIAYIYVNNMTLMAQPENWSAYFENSKGTLLNSADSTILPRYLHYIFASVAIGGLFMAILWNRKKNRGDENADVHIKKGLMIFSIASALQIAGGFWFLIALPRDIMMTFMGGDMLSTIILMLGIVSGIAMLVFGFLGKLKVTIIHVILTVVLMVISRANLRMAYMQDHFSFDKLELQPQYGVMFLFFAVLVIGLAAVVYMIRIVNKPQNKEAV